MSDWDDLMKDYGDSVREHCNLDEHDPITADELVDFFTRGDIEEPIYNDGLIKIYTKEFIESMIEDSFRNYTHLNDDGTSNEDALYHTETKIGDHWAILDYYNNHGANVYYYYDGTNPDSFLEHVASLRSFADGCISKFLQHEADASGKTLRNDDGK